MQIAAVCNTEGVTLAGLVSVRLTEGQGKGA